MRRASVFTVVAALVSGGAITANAQAPAPEGSACTAPADLTFSGVGIPVDQLMCVTSNAGVQLILSASQRAPSMLPVTETAPGSGVFNAPAGLGEAPNRALWNFNYAILGAANAPTNIFTLSVDTDPGLGASFITYPGFNTLLGDQNSENLGFAIFGGGTFDPTANGVYTFQLADNLATGELVDRVSINVIVGTGAPVTATPEPASLALMATGLAGLGGFVRRRKRNAAK